MSSRAVLAPSTRRRDTARTWRRRAAITAAVALWLGARSSGAGEPAYSYRSPFPPSQCASAAVFASRRLIANPHDTRARLVGAEALLCAGLDGDVVALERAIAALESLVAARPAGVFAALALADALRKRYPLSRAAVVMLERVGVLLASADVGAARADLGAYVAENLAAVEQSRQRTLPSLAVQLGELAGGSFSPASANDLAAVLSLVGPIEAECGQRLRERIAAAPNATASAVSSQDREATERSDIRAVEGRAWICTDPLAAAAARALGCCASEVTEHARFPRPAPASASGVTTEEEG